MTRRVIVGGLTVVLAVALAATLLDIAPARARAPGAPGRARVLLGAYVSPDGHAWQEASVTGFEHRLGRTLAIDHRFKHWNDPFPSTADGWDHAHGRTPMITWMPDGPGLDAIAAGRADDLIRTRADAVARDGRLLFLRFGHEMNADWYPWDGARAGGGHRRAAATTYIAAWRHVHAVFVGAGATNVRWVWSPNHRSIPTGAWNDAARYYPGDDVVDWIGIDGYDRSPVHRTSFASVFGRSITTLGRHKPVMIAETATDGRDRPAAAAAWIADARHEIATRYPTVRALVWFDTRKDGHDWRVDGHGAPARAFRALARDPVFEARR